MRSSMAGKTSIISTQQLSLENYEGVQIQARLLWCQRPRNLEMLKKKQRRYQTSVPHLWQEECWQTLKVNQKTKTLMSLFPWTDRHQNTSIWWALTNKDTLQMDSRSSSRPVKALLAVDRSEDSLDHELWTSPVAGRTAETHAQLVSPSASCLSCNTGMRDSHAARHCGAEATAGSRGQSQLLLCWLDTFTFTRLDLLNYLFHMDRIDI